MRNIFLTGFMGCGKTSVGQVLAAITGFRFVDLDRAIVEEAGATVKEIFAGEGEPAFRRLESEVLAKVAQEEGIIVSTGGGAVIAEDNRSVMRQHGTIVNLTASVAALVERLSGDSERPLLQDDPSGERIATLMASREGYYADADLRIDTTGKTVEAIAAEIVHFMEGEGNSRTEPLF
ncbi:shikimate kinase [Geomonas sp. RF6]|uniref:shikimate kinase n=1 Tax=Geomonas sp. RF6 TaxID=2897342 RepID=UPI001E2A60DF|nr:shikimate kinase [Geomonas sp. RF6]UFS69654.1 shikimate kinase [Geomonas sp. RF6]